MQQDPFPHSVPLRLPELGTRAEIVFLMWLVEEDSYVIPGERIAEVLTDGIVVHLDAPVAGRLRNRQVRPQEIVHTGAELAIIVDES